MDQLIIDTIAWGGYFGIALLMALENIVPPIPSELIMGIGGVLVAREKMDFWPLLLAGTIGSTAGNYAWFWVGDKWGFQRLEPFIARWGRWLTVDWEDIERASRFFREHGQWVVFFLRFSPIVRTIISLPAGLAHMKTWRFLLFTFLGAGVWNALLIIGGQWLAHYLDQSQGLMAWIILGAVGLTVAGYLWRLVTWKPRKEGTG